MVTARGDDGGIVQQTMTAPAALMLPATPTFGWLLYAPRYDRDVALQAYVVGERSANAVGKVETMRLLEWASEAEPHWFVGGDEQLELYVESDLNLPTRVELADGSRRTYVPAR